MLPKVSGKMISKVVRSKSNFTHQYHRKVEQRTLFRHLLKLDRTLLFRTRRPLPGLPGRLFSVSDRKSAVSQLWERKNREFSSNTSNQPRSSFRLSRPLVAMSVKWRPHFPGESMSLLASDFLFFSRLFHINPKVGFLRQNQFVFFSPEP